MRNGSLPFVLVLAAGCGGGGGSAPDADGVDDADVDDASVPDGPTACASDNNPGPASLVIATFDGSTTFAAVVHDPGGNILSYAPRLGNSDYVDVVPCGMVTAVVDRASDPRDIYLTWIDADVNDILRVPILPARSPTSYSVQVSFPDYPGATSYRLPPSTAPQTSPANMTYPSSDSLLHVLAIADTGGSLVWGGASASTGAGTIPVTIAAWSQSTVNVRFAVTDVPTDAPVPRLQVEHISGDMTFPLATADGPPGGGDFTLGPVEAPDSPGFGRARATVTFDHGHPLLDDVQLYSYGVSFQDPVALDYQDELMPRITGVAVEGSVPRPTVSWTTSADTADADVVIVSLESDAIVWLFVAPPGTTAVTLPSMPAELEPTTPLTVRTIAVLESSALFRYSGAREDLFTVGHATLTKSEAPMRLSMLGHLDEPLISIRE